MITLKVNGTDHTLAVEPTTRLSDVLRNHLGYTGTKVGCDAGDCGACSIRVDSELCCACLTAVGQVDGSEVHTIEGLATRDQLHAVQRSFLHHGAAQCGACTPGMLMAAQTLLETDPTPDRHAVEDALGGVLCRCTGYRKIVDAVVDAHQFVESDKAPNNAPIHPDPDQSVGASIRHVDGLPKVTGELLFGADGYPDDTKFVRVIRSPHHQARFDFGDIEHFIASQAGIDLFMKASDIPGMNCFGVIPPFADQPVFAEEVALHRGDAVAAIVGSREAVLGLSEDELPISWDVIAHTLDVDHAQSIDAPVLHANRQGNVLVRGHVSRGDATAALASTAHQVTVRTTTPFIEHAYIEPEAGYCVRVGDRLEVHGCTQATHMDRTSLADIMGLEPTAIRIRPSACGGGFGAKIDLSFQPFVALAAWLLNEPVGIVYSRGESMRSTTKRHPSDITLTIGCDVQGTLQGMVFDGTFNTGAYASWGPTVANRVPVHASGPYLMPNYAANSVAIHTNAPSSGAFRGFGVPQSAIAQETAFDQLADKVGMDRLEFRLHNALQDGQPTVTGQVFDSGVGISACLQALRPAWQHANQQANAFNTENNHYLRKGVGLGVCWYGCGNTSLPNPSTVRMGITKDGRIVLHQGAMDIGQGSNTIITQMAAEALGTRTEFIDYIDGDTDLTPDCGKTSASRQTFVTGMAAKLAGSALRSALLRHVNASDDAKLVRVEGGLEWHDGEHRHGVQLDSLRANEVGYVLMAEETYNPPTTELDKNGQGEPYALYGYGAQLMELTVDTELGTVSLDRMTTAHDVGRAINPLLIEAQIEGGVAQGIGLAMMEDYIPGVTENLHDYLIPTTGDMPTFEHIIVEVPDAVGPYGAKGLGEHVLIPTAPAILNAIRDATGAVVSHLPATPDKVLTAIEAVSHRGAA